MEIYESTAKVDYSLRDTSVSLVMLIVRYLWDGDIIMYESY